MATAGVSLSFFTIVWVEMKMSQNEVEVNSGKQFLSIGYWFNDSSFILKLGKLIPKETFDFFRTKSFVFKN